MFEGARLRLALWYAAAFAVILALVGASAYFLMRREIDREINSSLRRSVTELVNLRVIGVAGGQRGEGRIPPALRLPTDVFYVVIDQNGSLVLNPRDFDPASLPVAELQQHARAQDRGTIDFHAEDQHLRVVTVGFQNPTLGQSALVVGRSLEARDYQLRVLAILLFVGGFGGLVLASVGGFALAGRTLRPIRESLESQRRFVSDASHELRTPVAVMKANAELLLRHPDQTVEANIDQVAAITEESDHLARLVDDLLTLARADEKRLPMQREPVDLDELFGGLVRDMEALAEAKDVQLCAELRAGTVEGDPQRLRQLLGILVDNAVKFTPAGGRVTVDARRAGSRVTVSVADTGPGIQPEDLPHVFDRFYRGDRSRSPQTGTGLGLAIAKSIAEAHNGRLTAESAGRGATFVLRLPAK